MIQWENLGLQYTGGDIEPCKELTVSVAHAEGSGQLWLTDVCQQDIVVRDSATNEVVFRQPSHALLSPGSCVTFYEMASGKGGFSLVEDNGEGRAARRSVRSAVQRSAGEGALCAGGQQLQEERDGLLQQSNVHRCAFAPCC